MRPAKFDYNELSAVSQIEKVDEFELTTIDIPDHGIWTEKMLRLPHMTVSELRTEFDEMVEIHFDKSVRQAVHHCMTIKGEINAVFNEFNVDAHLLPMNYHLLYVPQDSYSVTIGKGLHNIHVEVDLDYYASLLCEKEEWSSKLKEKLLNRELSVGDERNLTQAMLMSVHGIFNGPLTGSLKKLLIEAKVHELIALQLGEPFAEVSKCTTKKDLDLFTSIREYLEVNFLLDHSLKGLSRKFGVNEFKLKKGFKEFFGTSVFDYLFDLRMTHALKLLQSNHTVKEVGSLLGYSYPNHFSAAFKKKFGAKPTDVVKTGPSLQA